MRLARNLALLLAHAASAFAQDPLHHPQHIRSDSIPIFTGDASESEAPRFEVDPFWPKPLPNHWIMGNVVGVAVDAQDHIWIVHRPGSLERMETYAAQNPPASDCCAPAPPVLEFDQAGNLIGHWGGAGEGYDWPDSMHGIAIDPDGNVWIGGNGRARPAPGTSEAAATTAVAANGASAPFHDCMLLKFTPRGKFLMQ